MNGNGPWSRYKEKYEYNDIKTIKESKYDGLCILTLEKEYIGPVSPLCLPEINNNQYEIVENAEIFGLGYPENFDNTVRSWLNVQPSRKKRQERKIQLVKGLEVKSSSQCAAEFRTWAFARKDGGFTWLEKYNGKSVILRINILLLF